MAREDDVEVRVQIEDEFVARKLRIHLDYWDADKWQLENRLLAEERAHKHKEALQVYKEAQMALALGLEQQQVFLVKLKLESAMDDLANFRTREAVLGSQLRLEKDKVKRLQQQLAEVRSFLATKETEFARKFDEQRVSQETVVQDLRQRVEQMTAELAKEKRNTGECKSKVSKELEALVRERDFVWNQLKCMEVHFRSQLKGKEEEIVKLQDSHELGRRLCNEREVELTITKMELTKAENESLELRDMIAENAEELRRTQRRLDEARQENENVRQLYAEMEAKFHAKHERISVKNARKDVTTRNLSVELEAATQTPRQHKRRKAKSQVDKETTGKRNRGESNAGKRRQVRSK